MEEYICKIASREEIINRWDELIRRHPDDNNWYKWKENNLRGIDNNTRICYYGLLDGEIICEATAIIREEENVENAEIVLKDNMAYLTAFRADIEYRGKKYFSKLYKFMENDLKEKGYTRLSLGVEPEEEKNKAIYTYWGFTNFLAKKTETFPDGEEITVEFYAKDL